MTQIILFVIHHSKKKRSGSKSFSRVTATNFPPQIYLGAFTQPGKFECAINFSK